MDDVIIHSPGLCDLTGMFHTYEYGSQHLTAKKRFCGESLLFQCPIQPDSNLIRRGYSICILYVFASPLIEYYSIIWSI